jgi:uncharacterized protein YndB with AHSA1/START domain
MAERDPDYVYVTYIRAPREKVWAAIIDRAPRPWWDDTQFDTTFKPGDPLKFGRRGGVDVRGKILDADPPNKLVHTFRVEGPGPQHDEGDTTVTYELTDDGGATKLTVTHVGFVAQSKLRLGIAQGWPAILSSLKTMLESGAGLELASWKKSA